MKVKVALGMLVLVGLVGTSDTLLAGRIAKRETMQHKRIHQGITSGELTRGEANVLRHEQQVIDRQKDRAWSDGELTRRERTRLGREQDKASKHIYRLKHNERERK